VDLHHHDDHTQLGNKADHPKIAYPKPDGQADLRPPVLGLPVGTNHEENQPCHLRLKDESGAPSASITPSTARRKRATARPACTKSSARRRASPRLQINGQNCLHCKTCDIKDPTQNINWTVPEGGGGPNYPNM
jgi:electron-transferring-flavoprotein dehydrogenase